MLIFMLKYILKMIRVVVFILYKQRKIINQNFKNKYIDNQLDTYLIFLLYILKKYLFTLHIILLFFMTPD
jgi:hypothetical protein